MQTLDWALPQLPFFEASHHALAKRVLEWNAQARAVHSSAAQSHGTHGDLNAQCRDLVASLAAAKLLDYAIPEDGKFDVRSICVIREGLTYEDALADTMFTMQGIGTMTILRHGTEAQRAKYLEPCRSGRHVAAFALTEPATGSDVASMTTAATRVGGEFVLNGAKTLITNAGCADHFLVIARTGEAPGSRGLSVFIVDAGTPGLEIGEPIDIIAPHPIAGLTFRDCRIPAANLIGEAGRGFKIAMETFNVFRPSVGAAAAGLARRALHETVRHTSQRRLFGKPMSELEGVQMSLADMATDTEAAALLVYRAAWSYDIQGPGSPYCASMGKLAGSEAAGRVVDKAVQLCGGQGVTQGNIIERLYREARPMRIYEGASEVQKLVIARAMLAELVGKS